MTCLSIVQLLDIHLIEQDVPSLMAVTQYKKENQIIVAKYFDNKGKFERKNYNVVNLNVYQELL